MEPINGYILHVECNCGFLKYGTVRDDPSCVSETANGELNEWVTKHLIRCRRPATYLAYMTPIELP